MFSGRRRVSTVPSGRAAKASLVGAVGMYHIIVKHIQMYTRDL